MVEIRKLPIGIWYTPSTALHVAAQTSFSFSNSSSVESHGAVPESVEDKKNTNYALIKLRDTGKAQILNACISSNKHPGKNYFKLWLKGGSLIRRKSLNPRGV